VDGYRDGFRVVGGFHLTRDGAAFACYYCNTLKIFKRRHNAERI
jgi:hypothetical protein